MIKKLIHTVLNFIFPQKCLGCKKENPPVGGICPECFSKIDYPSFIKIGNVYAATDYNDDIIRKSVWQLKYKGRKEIAEPLSELIFQRLESKAIGNDWLIIPVPLHKNRMKERGFNQSELIAQKFFTKVKPSEIQTSECLTNVLYKIKETPTQVSVKNRELRLKNLENAFEVRNADLIRDKKIILIDDISTTGATMRECIKTLKAGGAKKAIGFVVARG
ncbi:ComF family protein [Patescibacteria group bacterium]|nr:ComF family protein [Patescibacteria group bacterium]